MGIMDWFMRKPNDELKKIVHHAAVNAVRALPNEKQTKTKWEEQWAWYDTVMRRKPYYSKTVMENLRVIRDLNPDASFAIWNFIRLSNNGHTLEVIKPSGSIDKNSTQLLNELAARVGKLYGGGMDQLINVLLLTAFTQGAIALEVEINETRNDIVDFHAINPTTLDFRRNKDTGEVELVQLQNGKYVVMNPETVFYYPIDPDIQDPHGRSPILPVLQIIFFQIQVMKDLQKVLHHQGYERFDIEIVEQAIMENLPDNIKHGTPTDVQNYVTGYIKEIQKQMECLEPDDDFYHTSSIKIQSVGGASKGTVNAQGVIDIINQQVVAALKQLPILLGRNEGSTETHGTVQWQIYVAGIQSIQRGIKRLMEKAYNVSLQVYGRQGTTRIHFNEIRVQDRKNEAEAERVETETKIMQVNQGWIDNDEAAREIVGHDAVSDPIQTVTIQPAEPTPTEGRSVKKKDLFLNKKRATPDEYSEEVKMPWSREVAEVVTEFADETYIQLQRQMREYVARLEDSSGIPTRYYIRAENDPKEPSEAFRAWVFQFILIDSDEWREFWQDSSYTYFERAAVFAGTIAMADISSTISFDVRNPRMFQYLSERAESYSKIQDTNDERVIWELWEGRMQGEGIEQLARRLENMPWFNLERAYATARTEILTAARAGNHMAWLESGVVVGKRWNGHLDSRIRPSHRAAHGQEQNINDPFVVGGSRMMFPGDSSLGASLDEIIMCRCAELPILDDE